MSLLLYVFHEMFKKNGFVVVAAFKFKGKVLCKGEADF